MNKKIFSLLILISLKAVNLFAQDSTTPKWLEKLYGTDSTKVTASARSNFPDLLAPKSVHVTHFRQLNDSVTYCVYKADDGVCVFYYLATQRNRKPFTSVQIADNCKVDVSSITFATTNYVIDNSTNTFITKQLSATAMDNYLTSDGQFKRFKPGYNRNNAGMVKDSTLKQIHVIDNGMLEEHKVKPY